MKIVIIIDKYLRSFFPKINISKNLGGKNSLELEFLFLYIFIHRYTYIKEI